MTKIDAKRFDAMPRINADMAAKLVTHVAARYARSHNENVDSVRNTTVLRRAAFDEFRAT
jgi:hypothetical protein